MTTPQPARRHCSRKGVIGIGSNYTSLPTEIVLHYFVVTQYEGTPHNTAEMHPAWFSIGALPYEQMWPNDRYVLPALFTGASVRGWFRLVNAKTIASYQLYTTPPHNRL